jgi:hypothetical protein
VQNRNTVIELEIPTRSLGETMCKKQKVIKEPLGHEFSEVLLGFPKEIRKYLGYDKA